MTTLISALDIQSIIPHRYPFQLVDKVIHYVPGKEITAVKAVTIGEAFFSGHFPELPIMPGVLIIEALAQATSILLQLTERGWNPGDKIEKLETTLIGVLGNVKVNMLKPVHPGCFLYLHARLDWKKDSASSLKVEAYADDELCAQGSIVVALKEKLQMV
jgi:3-hydroxyacyl-[acyl-carrier-protein] dehydratase